MTTQTRDGLAWRFRRDLAERGYSAVTLEADEQTSRGHHDALLAENPRLAAVALRWDGAR